MRPEFRATTEQTTQVRVLAAMGWCERDIAAVIGCARDTLRRHFGDGLRHGRLQCKAEVLLHLFHAATSFGQAGAKRQWLQLQDQVDERRAADETGEPPEPL